MNSEIRAELESVILNKINDGVLTDENKGDWHFHAFNEDHFMIGYYETSGWLKAHNLGELEAANICIDYEKENFGEAGEYSDTEKVVNMLAYIWGEEVLSDIGADDIEELTEAVK